MVPDTSSLPEPLSPLMSTEVSVWAMRRWLWNMWLRPITAYDAPPLSPWKTWSLEEYTARMVRTAPGVLQATAS